MTITQQIATIALCAAATMLTRFVPFALFSEKKPIPGIVDRIGRALPGAVFAMLMIYCLKDVSFCEGAHGIPELTAIAATAGLHLWKRNMLLSIAGGTAWYISIAALMG